MMMGGMFLLPLLIIGVIAYLLGWRPQFGQEPTERTHEGDRPLDILRRRYARGDISKEEYDEMRRDLMA
jgi:putative membrane protein